MPNIVDPFFKSVDHTSSKRKRPNRKKSTIQTSKSKSNHKSQRDNKSSKKKDELDEEIEDNADGDGDGDDGLSADLRDDDSGGSEDNEELEHETPAQKRLRLAQVYLDRLQKSKESTCFVVRFYSCRQFFLTRMISQLQLSTKKFINSSRRRYL
jgi:hypothetical protein